MAAVRTSYCPIIDTLLYCNCMCIIVCVCVFFSLFVPCHAHSGALGSLLCGRMQSEVTHVFFFFIPVSVETGSLLLTRMTH